MAGIGKQLLLMLMLGFGCAVAQETLAPLRYPAPADPKAGAFLSLPFFDDFSDTALSATQWRHRGSLVNQGYAPLPPTIGMVTLDAFDDQGRLYPTETEQLFTADTLESQPIRLDSVFSPFSRSLSPQDSVYLSFFYLPGGGYGNMWERIGDCPETQDSLILEFYNPASQAWQRVWCHQGCSADTLFAHTGRYWQFCDIAITDSDFFHSNFQFRFRNYCSLDNSTKKGLLGNADQWNIDYVLLDLNRRQNDTASRDIAFVCPPASLLQNYQSMPARQFNASEMSQSLPVTITNRYSQQLAANYGYQILSADGRLLHSYDGGFENVPIFWPNDNYQASAPHANAPLSFVLPVDPEEPSSFTLLHGIREGVSGDIHTQNDTIRRTQHFDNYYAYDDGTPENGYGITSTSSRVRLACRFDLNVPDTLTALQLYFNHTLHEQNGDIRFYITVWDDADGHPGNIIYKDQQRRSPQFDGFNRFVRYNLEEPLLCEGTIYVGLEQTTADFLNLGFDRNNDASSRTFYLTSADWQTSILRGALMLRPCFGERATVGISQPTVEKPHVALRGNCISVTLRQPAPVSIYNILGQCVYHHAAQAQHLSPQLPAGIYIIKSNNYAPVKIVVGH